MSWATALCPTPTAASSSTKFLSPGPHRSPSLSASALHASNPAHSRLHARVRSPITASCSPPTCNIGFPWSQPHSLSDRHPIPARNHDFFHAQYPNFISCQQLIPVPVYASPVLITSTGDIPLTGNGAISGVVTGATRHCSARNQHRMRSRDSAAPAAVCLQSLDRKGCDWLRESPARLAELPALRSRWRQGVHGKRLRRADHQSHKFRHHQQSLHLASAP